MTLEQYLADLLKKQPELVAALLCCQSEEQRAKCCEHEWYGMLNRSPFLLVAYRLTTVDWSLVARGIEAQVR